MRDCGQGTKDTQKIGSECSLRASGKPSQKRWQLSRVRDRLLEGPGKGEEGRGEGARTPQEVGIFYAMAKRQDPSGSPKFRMAGG